MDDLQTKALKRTEQQIHSALSPIEPLVMKMQSLLVWEKPWKSLIVFIIFNLVFIYIRYSGQRILFILSMTALIAFLIHTWRHKLWPEIRLRPPTPENDQWIPLHYGLLSVPEISYHLAVIWHQFSAYLSKWLYLRRYHSFLFCVLNVAVLSFLAIIGRYMSGYLLTYLFFASLMVWPSVYFHDIPQKLYLRCEPIFMRLDYYLTFRGKFPGADKSYSSKDDATENDDDEFLPDPDPLMTAALAKAITDSEDEEQSPSLTPFDSQIAEENTTLLDLDLFPDTAEMPDVIDASDTFASSMPEKRAKKRRPRAQILTDTFQAPDLESSSPSIKDSTLSDIAASDFLSKVASDIVSDEITKAITSAFTKVDKSNSGNGTPIERNSSQESDIDLVISEDFDFLDNEEL